MRQQSLVGCFSIWRLLRLKAGAVTRRKGLRLKAFWIDVGGTFTDCLGQRADASVAVCKILSSGVYKVRARQTGLRTLVLDGCAGLVANYFHGFTLRSGAHSSRIESFDPHSGALDLAEALALDRGSENDSTIELASGEPAPIVGMRQLLGLRLDEAIGAVDVRLGTTRGTNALLERKGARTVLVTTAGFGQALVIGNQNRPKLFDLNIKKPPPLYERVIEADERVAVSGEVLQALDGKKLARDLAAAKASGMQSVAICFLHGYAFPQHEQQAAALAAAAGFTHVSVSSQLAPAQRLVPRAETTVVDAYLTPVLRAYVQTLQRSLPEARLRVMSSAGGLIAAANFTGKDSILSGPAGGVVGVARTAELLGLGPVIGFDMGGTSTDVCRYHERFEQRYEMELTTPEGEPGARIVAPMLTVETVAAGGGSICRFDGVRLLVGPESAGADPGPAAYGRGGPLTVTDCNLLLGRVAAEDFGLPLHTAAARARLNEVQAAMRAADAPQLSDEDLALGFLAVANSSMAAPIQRLSLAQGHDVREHALICFGGAGAQHACALARELGITRVVVPPLASLLSAYGIGAADVRVFAAKETAWVLAGNDDGRLAPLVQALRIEAQTKIATEGVSGSTRESVYMDLRYVGQDAAITVSGGVEAFAAEHERLYGFAYPGRAVEVRSVRVELVIAGARPAMKGLSFPKPLSKHRRVYVDDAFRAVPVFGLGEDRTIDGPAVIAGLGTTIIVEQDWTASIREGLVTLTARSQDAAANDSRRTDAHSSRPVDPVQLSLFNNRFAAIAEQMGAVLRRTALSVNIKERLDFSCALFTPEGDLVVNAPHIPVHLGSMGDTVRSILTAARSSMRPGDAFVTNDPYRGGSHLPDVTVVSPVFARDGKELLFFTASRAHHAEIGGLTPGSMPPHSRSLAEEGVLIRCHRLPRGDDGAVDKLATMLRAAPFPSRRTDDNLADIRAQIAANDTGRERLLALVDRCGRATVQAYMTHIQTAARTKVERALQRLTPGLRTRRDQLDDGTPIVVSIDIHGKTAAISFNGSGAPVAGNLNANPAIVRAAVFYALRCLIDEDIPLNQGVLSPVSLEIPYPSVLSPLAGDDPQMLAAVVAGNVETSQRLVDVLLGALDLAAASQGTMNNFLFGRSATAAGPGFGYYETIAGGAGATPQANGADGVHTHMTNTRITDAEVLEERFPVRVQRFALRQGSGGKGRYRGGEGLVREIEFLTALTVSLVSSRRVTRPFGLAGGGDGEAGRNSLKRAGSSQWVELPGTVQMEVHAGDVVRIETPGGGGFGS